LKTVTKAGFKVTFTLFQTAGLLVWSDMQLNQRHRWENYLKSCCLGFIQIA